jgi:hypothetical protein
MPTASVGHATETILRTAHGVCRIRRMAHGVCRIRPMAQRRVPDTGKKVLSLGERLGMTVIDADVAWDRSCLQTRGPCRVCLRDDLLAMSETIDGSDCAVIDGEIAASSPRRNGAGTSLLPFLFHVADGGSAPVLKQGVLDEYAGPSAAESFTTNQASIEHIDVAVGYPSALPKRAGGRAWPILRGGRSYASLGTMRCKNGGLVTRNQTQHRGEVAHAPFFFLCDTAREYT